MRNLIRLLFRPLKTRLCPDLDYYRPSFAQDGEDAILPSFFDEYPPVSHFYVDVGAYKPKRFSNTYQLYREGWRGINIDAMPGSMVAFQQERPGDINLEAAISVTPRVLTYHIFNEQGLNTFDEALARSRDGQRGFRLLERRKLETRTLTQLLDEHLPTGQAIALLSVDVEGYDLEVLESLDFSRYHPQFVLLEDRGMRSLFDISKSETVSLMKKKGYAPVGRTFRTLLLLDTRSLSTGRK